MSRRGCLALAAVASAAVAACGGPVYSYRYRLTVEVDTPEGLKSGSSVIETTVQDDTKAWWGPIESRIARTTTTGEAVFVDLGQGRNVIALLAMGPEGTDDPDFNRLVPGIFGLRGVESLRTIPERKGRFTVPNDLLPTLVSFANINDPRTAVVLQPDNFEAVLGPGFRFRRAWVEITQDALTSGIKKRIPWLSNYEQIVVAWRAMKKGNPYGPSTGPDRFFVRN